MMPTPMPPPPRCAPLAHPTPPTPQLAQLAQQQQLAGYYQHVYQAQGVPAAASYPAPPPRHQLAGLPCISHRNAYCQTASLQIIDRAHASPDIHYYNWLTGFTYGAHFQHELGSFLPYGDPEVGLQAAAPALGLRRRYCVTNDVAAFGRFLRHLLAHGLPVRVALNGHLLLGKPGFFPHSVVVVGYDGDEVAYYETGNQDRYLLGHAGERAPLAALAEAAAQLQAAYHYPWRYNLTVFEPTAAPAPALTPAAVAAVWHGHSATLRGTRTPFSATGAQALRALAEHVQARPPAPAAWAQAQGRLAAGAYTRRDNAAFLRRHRPGHAGLAAAADHFEASAAHFAALGQAPAHAADHLRAAAALEERIADLFAQL